MTQPRYEVRVARSADKAIQALPSDIRQRIEAAIVALATDPFPHGCEKLGSENRWRIRIGKYRIILQRGHAATHRAGGKSQASS